MSDGLTEARKGFNSYKEGHEIKDGVPDINVQKSFIFRIKIDAHLPTRDFFNGNNIIKCDPNGEVYIITDNPSKIYECFGNDNVVSIEKISNGYIIK